MTYDGNSGLRYICKSRANGTVKGNSCDGYYLWATFTYEHRNGCCILLDALLTIIYEKMCPGYLDAQEPTSYQTGAFPFEILY